MATDDFISVTGDDWYQRRRQDAEGDFFRKMADSAGRKGEGGMTRQGIYMFAADGTVLGYKNAGQNVEVMKQVLRQALANFDRLPAAQRKPGAIVVGEPGRSDPSYSRTPPPGGLIIKVWGRILDYKDGAYCKGSCSSAGGDKAS